MALIPLILDELSSYRPTRFLDRAFDLDLDEDNVFGRSPNAKMLLLRRPTQYIRPWKSKRSRDDCGSLMNISKEKFEAKLDVKHFNPDEISVKVTGKNEVTIEGKHEEKEDEHGLISRHFVRKYVVPEDFDMNKIESKLSKDGILAIVAPKIQVEESEYRQIPIVREEEENEGSPRKKKKRSQIENGV